MNRTALGYFFSLLLAALWFMSDPALGQERIVVNPSGVMTWAEMQALDALQAKRPLRQHAIHSPLEGPGPRELPLPDDASQESDVAVPQQPPLPSWGATRFGEPPLIPMSPTLDFDAIQDNNTSIPPDTYGSVGPSHVMTMLNTEVRIQSKTGTIVSTVSLSSFWSSIAGSKFDPKVNYDAGSGRWLAVVDADANSASSKVCFAISATSDPTGAWTFYSFVADAGGTTWADYPGFGHNSTWIAITHNMFTVSGSPSFAGAKMWVIDKSTALAGGPLTTTVFLPGFDVSGGVNGFTLQPCITFGAEPNLYIVDNSGYSSGGTFLVRISRITGTGAAPVWSVQPGSVFANTGLFFVANNFFFTQSDAPQSGIATLVETNDPRMLNAVFRNSRIWCTHTAGLPVGGPSTRTAVFWYQLNPTAMPSPIVQSGVFDGGAGVHHYFPSITANSADAACIGFSRSDATKFVEAVYSGRLSSHPLGTMPFGIQVYKLGESSYSKFFGGGLNRWGDYSNVCVDPSDDLTFWSIQEYAGMKVGSGVDDGRWSTRWAKIVPPQDLPIQLASFTGMVVNGNSVRLDWRTISEANNYGFELERSPNASGNYELVPNSFVPGHGTSNEPRNYTFTEMNVPPGVWYYRLKQMDLDGTIHYYDGVRVEVFLTDVPQERMPTVVALHQNHPNPFNPSTTISLDLPANALATLKVYDLVGREVATLLNGFVSAGRHALSFDASHLASGIYIYRLVGRDVARSSEGFVLARKMAVLK